VDSRVVSDTVEFGMTYITGYDRSQLLLLPEAVDDYVGSDNPVRFIDAFVDGLDLAAAGFGRVEPRVTGRPGYAPADLLKLYIYGYLNRVRSSRRLEAETHRNIEVIWLLRHLKPDFKTIADFRRDNRNAFRQVFREFVLLCRQLDLFGRELLAVDGTRIKAVNIGEHAGRAESLRQRTWRRLPTWSSPSPRHRGYFPTGSTGTITQLAQNLIRKSGIHPVRTSSVGCYPFGIDH
jgi:transposase